MVLKHGGKLTKTKQGKWLLYISAKLADDSTWPFPEGTQDVEIEIGPQKGTLFIKKIKPVRGEKNGKD